MFGIGFLELHVLLSRSQGEISLVQGRPFVMFAGVSQLGPVENSLGHAGHATISMVNSLDFTGLTPPNGVRSPLPIWQNHKPTPTLGLAKERNPPRRPELSCFKQMEIPLSVKHGDLVDIAISSGALDSLIEVAILVGVLPHPIPNPRDGHTCTALARRAYAKERQHVQIPNWRKHYALPCVKDVRLQI